MMIKRTFMTIFLFLLALPVWAQTPARDLNEYVGLTVDELLGDLGAPVSLTLSQPLALLFHYTDIEFNERAYVVDFVVTGPWVEVVRASQQNEAVEPKAIAPAGLIDDMGQSRGQLVVLAGPFHEYVAFEWDGVLLENMVFEVSMDGHPWRLICDLENNRVVTLAYQYSGEMAADEVRVLVEQLDAEALALLNDPVWCLDDTGYDEISPEDHRWRYQRLAADETYGLQLLTRATPETGHLFLNLLLLDLKAKGFVGRGVAVSHMKGLEENWYKETSRYVNSGNDTRLKALLKLQLVR